MRRPEGDVVAGRNPVGEALTAEIPATALLVAHGIDADKRVTEAIRFANAQGVPVREVQRAELDRVTGGAHHQGLALTIPAYAYTDPMDLLARASESGDAPLLVALDGVTDPHNLGAVVRSAAAFGAHGVVVPERRAAGMTAGAWKASAGAAARLPVARATNLPRTLKLFADAGVLVAGLAGDGEAALDDLDATGALCLVVGSEGRGLSRLVGERCDLRVAVPLATGTESLNASVATGIALYVVAERRRREGRL
jgi:23S rRNA (guanosine2251-2'-O)-methyltransferase